VIPRLVLASSNAGKLREFRRLLTPLGLDVIAQAELGIADTDEPHATFIENALAKARHASIASDKQEWVTSKQRNRHSLPNSAGSRYSRLRSA